MTAGKMISTRRRIEMATTSRSTSRTKPTANGASVEVLTLPEAAAYLRLAESEVVDLIRAEGLPARPVADGWRFLKSALQDWLRASLTGPGKQAMLARIGTWRDDPTLDEMLRDIYRKRGRPMTESKR
jgi:excisionase family DNA binding protein